MTLTNLKIVIITAAVTWLCLMALVGCLSNSQDTFINGQVNGFIIGCKNSGTPFPECVQRSKGYENWLRCDYQHNKCN